MEANVATTEHKNGATTAPKTQLENYSIEGDTPRQVGRRMYEGEYIHRPSLVPQEEGGGTQRSCGINVVLLATCG